MPNFDEKNPFSVADAARLIKEAKVQINDLSVAEDFRQGGSKEGDWTNEVGCPRATTKGSYLSRLHSPI
eukprot:SAG11_NODE_123_length_15805_cov_15.133261_2_plen_69_part_00